MNHCIDCKLWRGNRDGRSFGKCSKIHTNANHALIWRHFSGYVGGDEIETTGDFGCVLWEPLTVMVDSLVSSHPTSDG